MKLLYLSPSPPNELERVRSLNILKSLKSLNIDVTLVTLYNKRQEKYLQVAKPYVEKIIAFKYKKIIALLYATISLILPIPIRVGYCFNFKLRKFLKNNKQNYDIAYIKRLRMAQYKKYINSEKTFIDITDSLTKYYERLYKKEKSIKKILYLEEYYKHKKYEVKVCEENSNIIICSEEDKKYLEKISNKTKENITVIENVSDLKNWEVEKVHISKMGERNKLVFCGIMNYEPNILAVEYIINNIMTDLDEKYSLEIVGPKVNEKIKKLENGRVKFLGYVESVKDVLKEKDIFICPIIVGSGTKNKIIQASMTGLPIICTKLSIEGLYDEMKNVVYLAEKPKDFVKQIEIINKTSDEELRRRIENQKQIIKQYNSLNVIIEKFKKLLNN